MNTVKTDNIEGTAYQIIADITGLVHYDDNLYKDAEGNVYIRDKFGFHFAIIERHHKLIEKENLLQQAIVRYSKMMTDPEELSKRQKKRIMMWCNSKLSDAEIIEAIKGFIKSISPGERY